MVEVTSGVCLADGCNTVAKLKCPNCSKLGRQSFFCSQEHFKQEWATHKKTHVSPKPVPADLNVTSSDAEIARATELVHKIRELVESTSSGAPPALTADVQARLENKLQGAPGLQKAEWLFGDFKSLLTPNTMMKFETPRLTVRSVEPSDNAWIYSVKGDPRVNKYQLYGQPTGKRDASSFGNGYIRDRIPLLNGRRSNGEVERSRYVFAITPKADQIPQPKSTDIPRIRGLPQCPPLPHADGTYIGNVAFEVYTISGVVSGAWNLGDGPDLLLIPPNEIFHWPDVESPSVRRELDQYAALLFYEIAPQYWGQGLMLEAILSIADFVFFDLGLGFLALDPQVANASSISVARKLPDMAYVSTIRCRSDPTIQQHVFVLSRADYINRYGRPSNGQCPAGKTGCAWCYNPRARVRGEGEMCSGCEKRWYCGIECRVADWESHSGHGVSCKK